jgi:hypothetical protein
MQMRIRPRALGNPSRQIFHDVEGFPFGTFAHSGEVVEPLYIPTVFSAFLSMRLREQPLIVLVNSRSVCIVRWHMRLRLFMG